MASIKRVRKLFEDSIQLFLNNIEKCAISGKPFDIRSYLESFVLDTSLRSFFGIEMDSANDSKNPLVTNSRDIFMKDISLEQLIALSAPTIAEILDLRAFSRKATDFMTKLLQTIINERKHNNHKRNDLLQILLESNYINENTSSKLSE
jgi:cytochrome P450 family 3 subfamily A/cytochrome P450 family 3 subfamily C